MSTVRRLVPILIVLVAVIFVAGSALYLVDRFSANAQPGATPTPSQGDTCAPVGNPAINFTLDKHWRIRVPKQTTSEQLRVIARVENVATECLTAVTALNYSVQGSDLIGTLPRSNDGSYGGLISIKDLKVGQYGIISAFNLPSGQTVSGKTDFFISYPLYVLWTLDWEGFDIRNEYLDQINDIAVDNHDMPLTHFFNPRYFLAKSFPQSRKRYFVDWVNNRQKKYGDNVGLHIHAFNDVVTAAGVKPHTSQQWSDRNDGYDIPLSSYSPEDQYKIISFSLDTLRKNGFNSITAFRAGGWYATEDTLEQISKLALTVDASGRTPYSFGQNRIQGPWQLTSTSQPYRPCRTNQNQACSGSNAFPLWEIPNNGADSWLFKADQMIERFNDNYKKKPLTKMTVVTFLSHPEWFYRDNPVMREVFKHVDQYTYAKDKGPVQFVTVEQLRQRL